MNGKTIKIIVSGILIITAVGLIVRYLVASNIGTSDQDMNNPFIASLSNGPQNLNDPPQGAQYVVDGIKNFNPANNLEWNPLLINNSKPITDAQRTTIIDKMINVPNGIFAGLRYIQNSQNNIIGVLYYNFTLTFSDSQQTYSPAWAFNTAFTKTDSKISVAVDRYSFTHKVFWADIYHADGAITISNISPTFSVRVTDDLKSKQDWIKSPTTTLDMNIYRRDVSFKLIGFDCINIQLHASTYRTDAMPDNYSNWVFNANFDMTFTIGIAFNIVIQ